MGERAVGLLAGRVVDTAAVTGEKRGPEHGQHLGGGPGAARSPHTPRAPAWLLEAPPTGTTTDGRPVWRVPLIDFLAQVRPAYNGPGWDTVLRAMSDDPDEAERVATLAIAAGSGFRQPIILDRDDREVVNGMHRVVATIVAGTAHVDVTDRYADITREQLRIEFELNLPPAHPYDDMADAAVALLWSFPVGEDWAETDCIYGNGPLIGGYWYWPAARADELVAAMTARAATRGATMRVHTGEPHDPEADADLSADAASSGCE